jgi:hypothetical protein
MNWFDEKILRKKEATIAPEPRRRSGKKAVPARRQTQVAGDNATQIQTGGDLQTDFSVDGTDKARAYIKVWEKGVSDWSYRVDVFYKDAKKSYIHNSVMGRGILWEEKDARRAAGEKASLLAQQLRVELEPKSAEYELEL